MEINYQQKKHNTFKEGFCVIMQFLPIVQDLKKYMAYIENEAKLAGEELSTLRFYFANYPDQDKFPDGKEVVHRRQNSIMMSPTVKRNDKDYIFYFYFQYYQLKIENF